MCTNSIGEVHGLGMCANGDGLSWGVAKYLVVVTFSNVSTFLTQIFENTQITVYEGKHQNPE